MSIRSNIFAILFFAASIAAVQADGINNPNPAADSSGGPCTATASSIQYDATGSFGCVSGATSNGSALTIASGDLKLSGSLSGTVTLNAPASGGGTITLPAGSVTLAPTASPTFTGVSNFPAGSASTPSLSIGNATTGLYSVSTTGLGVSVNGTKQFDYGITASSIFTFAHSINIGVSSGSYQINGAALLTAVGAAWQLGAADAASPVAQMLQVQNVVAGNTNTAGANWTFQGSLSNGSGAGGNIILSTTQSIAASGSQNTALPGITILGGTQLVEINQITSDAALTDTTVCQDTTLHGLHAGSGTAGICLGNVSSIRFKRDWNNIDDGLEILAKLNPGTYRYKEGVADSGARIQYGFKAEDYARVLPVLTRYDESGLPNGVDMMGLVPVMASAIKELKGEFEQYKREHP